jgi:hypothetical protein
VPHLLEWIWGAPGGPQFGPISGWDPGSRLQDPDELFILVLMEKPSWWYRILVVWGRGAGNFGKPWQASTRIDELPPGRGDHQALSRPAKACQGFPHLDPIPPTSWAHYGHSNSQITDFFSLGGPGGPGGAKSASRAPQRSGVGDHSGGPFGCSENSFQNGPLLLWA